MDAKTREALTELLDEFGCGDNSCIFRRPKGMATNGGCRTLHLHPRDMQRVLQRFALRVRALLDAPEPEPPRGEVRVLPYIDKGMEVWHVHAMRVECPDRANAERVAADLTAYLATLRRT